MSAYWKDGTEGVWVCSHGEEHPERDVFCRAQEPSEKRPPAPQAAQSGAPADLQSTEGFYLTLPNGVRIQVDRDLTIGRGLDSVIGLSLLQFADVSRAHLDVFLEEDRSLRFAPLKVTDRAPVYYYPMPAPRVLTVESLGSVRPELIAKGDERLDGLILDWGSSESRLFCLGQHCMIRFEWGTE